METKQLNSTKGHSRGKDFFGREQILKVSTRFFYVYFAMNKKKLQKIIVAQTFCICMHARTTLEITFHFASHMTKNEPVKSAVHPIPT